MEGHHSLGGEFSQKEGWVMLRKTMIGLFAAAAAAMLAPDAATARGGFGGHGGGGFHGGGFRGGGIGMGGGNSWDRRRLCGDECRDEAR